MGGDELKKAEGDDFKRVYNYAVFMLSIRLRTEGELLGKLSSKYNNESAVNKVLQKLKEQRFLDDQRYAEIFLDNLKKYKNFGFYGIKKKMMEKKLPISLIEKTLRDGLPVEDETKIAERLLKKDIVKNADASAEATKQTFSVIPAKAGIQNYDEKNRSPIRSGMTNKDLKIKLARKLQSKGFRSEVIAKFLK